MKTSHETCSCGERLDSPADSEGRAPMKSWFRHPFRVTLGLLWFAAELAIAAVDYAARCGFRKRESLPLRRALWLQRASLRMRRVLAVDVHMQGAVPSHGLLVSNHLSYVDILVLAGIMPSVFVAKSEVRSWPVIGWFVSLAGTVFVHRERKSQTVEATGEIEEALRSEAVVILFPEGTSSDGRTVLPFKSSLLEPATQTTRGLYAALIQYELEGGDAGQEVCYWGDMTFFTHLLNLFSKKGPVHATVKFAKLEKGSANRKELAVQLHQEVTKLKETVAA